MGLPYFFPHMAIKVLFVTTTYPLKQGDAVPSFVADLAGALVRDQGVEVRVIAPHHPGVSPARVAGAVQTAAPRRLLQSAFGA